MGAATATAHPQRVRASKRQTRRRRRLRFAKAAADAARDETIRGVGPSIARTVDYHMAKACGFDAMSREMRVKEPPTRSTSYPMPPTTASLKEQRQFPAVPSERRLNRANAWHTEGDAKVLVKPTESPVWQWFLTLGDDAQDEIYELSVKCSGKDDGVCHADADPMELLRDMPAKQRTVVLGQEDARAWGAK